MYMYGCTEAETSDPSEGLKPLIELAKLLLPRLDEKRIEMASASLAPWSAAESMAHCSAVHCDAAVAFFGVI